jgi:hypothetical protein
VRIAGNERRNLDPETADPQTLAPTAEIRLLATFDRYEKRVYPGVPTHPRVGARLYSPSADFLAYLVKVSGTIAGPSDTPQLTFKLGAIPGMDALVEATPERLFGRHCAILGSTGGGKSFTLARLVEEASTTSCKVIVLDPTGEFSTTWPDTVHAVLGATEDVADAAHVPYSALDEQDLYALFMPSGRAQGPKFRQAIESLRIAEIAKRKQNLAEKLREHNLLSEEWLITKANQVVVEFERARLTVAGDIEKPDAPLDVMKLAKQIVNECVWPTGRYDKKTWGDPDEGSLTHCLPLISRIHTLVRAPELASVFKAKGANLFELIDQFIAGDHRVLRISLELVPHSFHAREVIANAIGRRLLKLARERRFRRSQPVVVFLDEAHHFLNRKVGFEDSAIQLDAFELIAKEGRKYWLTLAVATQRPRDLPEGVLSQIGTMIVHRLINDSDREIVERACGEIDRSAASFLPTLAPGEAALIGVDFPFPLTVRMIKPTNEPESKGPDFQHGWRTLTEGR